ncbi:zinc finger and BTB domain-containing protein 21 [Corythoichthys intestinalis]|uniref:zinc finger and BTB domain-containing protein 21 n=1 Tax=Corythoichthys intestinalis TaxID=161448 RepID=UPI0025A60B60|nr:zinc finger and BTB domain-containing protein 21 [Corythoichthys intestinalis]XP_061801913.1 zinc finger and BTB domain-containing protein 21-like [Nerophis lumbriciformis]
MESLVHYSYPTHALSVLGLLNEQRLRGHMCDVVLIVADQRYQAHKSVLAASSEYFQSLFTRMDDASLKVVNLDFCEPDAFEIVLNYIYSSSLFVEKSSISAIQELGYTLGIPFLTNIVSTRPHASYCVSRKRLSYTEGDDNDVQTRSVIVCRVRNDTPESACANFQAKTPESSSSLITTELTQPPSELNSCDSARNSEQLSKNSPEHSESSTKRSTHPYASILKGNPSCISFRPQLKTSASFSDAEVQHITLPSYSEQNMKLDSGEQEPQYCTKVAYQGPASELSQTIDRSGPLIKSLLRRSLSMDSPVPVFSPTLELKELQNHEQSVGKMASKLSDSKISARNGNSRRSPIILKSKYHNRCDGQTQVEREQVVKVEPSSPLADPLDIVRITVEEGLPVNLKNLQTNYEPCSKVSLIPFGKRKERSDNRRYPFKKNKIIREQAVSPEENASEVVSLSTSDDNENNQESSPSKIFTCWNCFKVFRSSAGLHRHVNMYHNPEKPYACDICHKRFHTNFKVWTHCQTQHGVLQNPASSSSSPVMDDRFQKKLIDIVREREIKKALLWKLKRNKQALQSSTLCKKRSRSNFVCPYCGKAFVFQSQYRQHLRTHPAEKADKDTVGENILYQEQDEVIHQNNSDAGVYACRLCNMKLPSLIEQCDHERGCRNSTVCPYCGLKFSSATVKKDHEVHCKYKKLTCLECMRTFKTSFSIWRHQVEVHNNNMMNMKEQMSLRQQEHNEGMSEMFIEEHYNNETLASDSNIYNDSSGTHMYDSEDSSSYMPEDLSMGRLGKLVVKEEPLEEAVSEREETETSQNLEEPGVWPCEKCGSLFSSRKDLERHQELLCHIKPFICHICNKAFRTNFRLWSHFQSHMSNASEHSAKEMDGNPPPPSPSPPTSAQNSERRSPQASLLTQAQPVGVAVADESSSPEPSMSAINNAKIHAQHEQRPRSRSPASRSNSAENSSGAQDSETLFYHAPSLSALTFKRQYMCKLCHRTFKTAFSLWSHEQSHGHV